METILRAHAEQQFAAELYELEQADRRPRPTNWRLSPWAVATYILGGTLDNGFAIAPKYIGNGRLIEIAIATLTTDRALLLMGIPGTGKTWVSEHLAAAISGDSTLLVQGTAGTSEEAIRYGWNYAQLLAHGPSEKAMVPSPMMEAMRLGKFACIEELTRIPADVQDSLITVLSEKTLPIPELGSEMQAVRGFSVIATANIVLAFFEHREAHAARLGLKHCVFCAVQRAADDPRRPSTYVPLDDFWRKRGYAPIEGCTTTMRWQEIGEQVESPKPMQFWRKTLGA